MAVSFITSEFHLVKISDVIIMSHQAVRSDHRPGLLTSRQIKGLSPTTLRQENIIPPVVDDVESVPASAKCMEEGKNKDLVH